MSEALQDDNLVIDHSTSPGMGEAFCDMFKVFCDLAQVLFFNTGYSSIRSWSASVF